MTVLTTIELRRWFAQLGVEASLPRNGKVLILELPGSLGGIWRVERQSKDRYAVVTMR